MEVYEILELAGYVIFVVINGWLSWGFTGGQGDTGKHSLLMTRYRQA